MSDIKEFDKIVKDCQEVTDIQCTKGNYDQSEYMRGMANGMKVLMSVLNNKEPEFIVGRKMKDKIIISEIVPQVDGKMSDGLAKLLLALVEDNKTLNRKIAEIENGFTKLEDDTSYVARYGL